MRLVHVGLVQDRKLLDLFLLLVCLVPHDEQGVRIASTHPEIYVKQNQFTIISV